MRDKPTPALARAWAALLDFVDRTRGIPLVASIVILTGWVMAFTAPGRDIVVAVAEDDGWTAAWLCLSVTLCGLQAWFWSRRIVVSGYGPDRSNWRPRWLLVWGPRVIGLSSFGFLFAALLMSRAAEPMSHAGLPLGLAVTGVALAAGLIAREDVVKRFTRNPRSRLAILLRGRPALFRRGWILLSFGLAVASFTTATVWPVGPAQGLGPAATVYLAAASVIAVMGAAAYLGRRARLPLMGGLLVGAAIVSALPFADNHGVGRRAFGGSDPASISGRTTLDAAYRAWSSQAPGAAGGSGLKSGLKPIIFVASEGGASRASYWNAETLGRLQDETGGRFSRLVFGISSVSGASVGAWGFVASLDGPKPGGGRVREALESFTSQDYLSPALDGALFPDLMQRFVPVGLLPDRAETIERGWEAGWAAHCRTVSGRCDPQRLQEPFLSLWSKPGPWRPALLVEGAAQETGRRIMTSSLAADAVDADDFHRLRGADVRASTAILNGARYPWVSPAGRIDLAGGKGTAHIVDGGYFDATGIEAAKELADATLAQARDPALTPIFVIIGNCAPTQASRSGGAPLGATPFLGDALAPLDALFHSREALGQHLEHQFLAGTSGAGQAPQGTCADRVTTGSFHGLRALVVPLMLCAVDNHPAPLDWVLSGDAQRRMQTAAADPRACAAARNLDELVRLLNGVIAPPWPSQPAAQPEAPAPTPRPKARLVQAKSPEPMKVL